MTARIEADDLLEVAVGLEREAASLLTLARQVRQAMAKQRPQTASLPAGMPCGEYAWNQPEVAVHDVAPPEDGFASHDEPPSRPLP